MSDPGAWGSGWESFIIHLDILMHRSSACRWPLRIFHYSPWYTYSCAYEELYTVENLSLFALIYLVTVDIEALAGWESFIIRLDILTKKGIPAPARWESFIIRLDILIHVYSLMRTGLRIFHYSPWYTYTSKSTRKITVENLSLFALIYLLESLTIGAHGWESFIIRLDILIDRHRQCERRLRIFHYSPWYT